MRTLQTIPTIAGLLHQPLIDNEESIVVKLHMKDKKNVHIYLVLIVPDTPVSV